MDQDGDRIRDRVAGVWGDGAADSEIDGARWTDFPPPPGFDGEQHGEHGQQPYRRACSREERDAIRTMRARDDAEEARRRDLCFARLNDVSAPT